MRNVNQTNQFNGELTFFIFKFTFTVPAPGTYELIWVSEELVGEYEILYLLIFFLGHVLGGVQAKVRRATCHVVTSRL